MKIILSRKGFDSQYGGVPSPIFPDGGILSLPIPSSAATVTYGDLTYQEIPVGELVENLTQGDIRASDTAHLDPDLDETLTTRTNGWIPSFGQVGSAQAHLANQGVGPGDLFLFFGWFREIERTTGRWRFNPNAPDLHVLFGWLWVNEVLRVGANTRSYAHQYPALATHPHLVGEGWNASNTVYTGKDAGVFEKISEQRILTEPEQSRSVWRLPGWFYPRRRTPLTFHTSAERWSLLTGGSARLRTASRGQEFVLDAYEYPEAMAWIDGLMSEVA